MTDEELIARMRQVEWGPCQLAADRLEALVRECEIRDAATQEGKRLWAEAEARADAAEARADAAERAQLEADNALVDRYRDPQSGRFNFPTDVAAIIRRLDAAEAALAAERETVARLTEAKKADPAEAFNNADWFWRTMDPDDCGDSPEEAINRAMVGRFCVCEIASSYAGPTRYGFIAPVLDADSDEEEFVHFATQQEAVEAAKARAALTEAQKDRTDD